MAWRGVHLSEPATVSRKSNAILVERSDKPPVRLPFEDIGWIVVDNREVSLSSSVMASCAEHGIAVIVTDSTHTPCATLLPFAANYAQAEVAGLQVDSPRSVYRRLWARIVRGKLQNQSANLQRILAPNWQYIRGLLKEVKPGDPANVEARAARRYWGSLLTGFRRDSDGGDRLNDLLNYGYAVTRAAVARSLAVAGLIPAIGVHHRSVTNPFNLADDMIEPFRPVVDLAVYEMREPNGWDEPYHPAVGLSINDRRDMASVLTREVRIDDQLMNASDAIDHSVASLVRSFRSRKAGDLQLPEIP